MNTKKMERYLKENKIVPLFRNEKVETFIVEGDTGTWNVRFQKDKNLWSCDCKNLRLNYCIHIICCQRFKNEKRI
jgi:hypothetical protein